MHYGGRGWGPLQGWSGEPSCCPGPCTSAVLSVPASCEGAKIPEPQQEKRPRQRLLSFLPLLTPESCQCTRDGRGRCRQSGDLDPCSLADLGLDSACVALYFGIEVCKVLKSSLSWLLQPEFWTSKLKVVRGRARKGERVGNLKARGKTADLEAIEGLPRNPLTGCHCP